MQQFVYNNRDIEFIRNPSKKLNFQSKVKINRSCFRACHLAFGLVIFEYDLDVCMEAKEQIVVIVIENSLRVISDVIRKEVRRTQYLYFLKKKQVKLIIRDTYKNKISFR